MLLGLVSAKGSPGVTTAALTLAAHLGADGVLVEFDPSGGSVECWTGTTGEPGLVRTASALRRSIAPDALLHGVTSTPPGVSTVLAPTAGGQAESAVAAIGERLGSAAADAKQFIVLDAGRWSHTQPTARRLSGCDHVLVVCQPSIAGIESARALVDSLRSTIDGPVELLLVGERPYSDRDVVQATGLPVVGVLPWDARAVNDLLTVGPTKGWFRTGLARSAGSILTTVIAAYASRIGVVA